MISCPCGLTYRAAAELTKIGWLSLTGGEFAFMVACSCKARIVAAIVLDGALCTGCRRLVVGDIDDRKVVTQDGAVYCVACALRAGVESRAAVALVFRRWVEKGDRSALQLWRAAAGDHKAA